MIVDTTGRVTLEGANKDVVQSAAAAALEALKNAGWNASVEVYLPPQTIKVSDDGKFEIRLRVKAFQTTDLVDKDGRVWHGDAIGVVAAESESEAIYHNIAEHIVEYPEFENAVKKIIVDCSIPVR